MKELRLKLPQFHIFPLCLCYLFLPFVSLPTTHTLTPERGWARERAREHAQACEGIDRWSIIRHEQPRKVGQRKDGAYGICLNSEDIQWLEKMNEWDLGLLFVWVLLPVLCVTVACWRLVVSSALEPEWPFLFILRNRDTLYNRKTRVNECEATDPTPGSAQTSVSSFVNENNDWPIQQ